MRLQQCFVRTGAGTGQFGKFGTITVAVTGDVKNLGAGTGRFEKSWCGYGSIWEILVRARVDLKNLGAGTGSHRIWMTGTESVLVYALRGMETSKSSALWRSIDITPHVYQGFPPIWLFNEGLHAFFCQFLTCPMFIRGSPLYGYLMTVSTPICAYFIVRCELFPVE